MKRVKQVGVRQSLLLAGLILASVGAEASVALNAPVTTSYVSGVLSYELGSASGSFSETDSSDDGSVSKVNLNRKGFGYRAKASAEVDQLQTRVKTKLNSGAGNGDSSANASATWSEWFVISGGVGDGMASFESLFEGKLTSVKNGDARYSLNIDYSTGIACANVVIACGESDLSQSVFSEDSGLSDKGKTRLSRDIEGEFTFAYDQPFQLSATLNVAAANGGTANFSLNALGSGLVLPDSAYLMSAAGYAALQAVPEPETYAMLLAGLGLVGFAARRRVQR